MKGAGAIQNLESFLADEKFPPMENEVAYVGQQLWPNFAGFISEVRKG